MQKTPVSEIVNNKEVEQDEKSIPKKKSFTELQKIFPNLLSFEL